MIGPKMLQVKRTCGWWDPVGTNQSRALGEDMAQAHPFLLRQDGDVVMGCPCVLQPPGMGLLLVGSWVRVEVIEP